MPDNDDEPISRSDSINRISAAYASMYAPVEPEVNETEIENDLANLKKIMRHRNPNMNEIDRQRNAKLFLTKLSMEAHEKEEKRLRKERYMTKKAEKMNKA